MSGKVKCGPSLSCWQCCHWLPVCGPLNPTVYQQLQEERRPHYNTGEIEITFNGLVGRAFISLLLPFLWHFLSFMHLLKRKETRKMFDSPQITQPLKVCRYKKKLPNNILICFLQKRKGKQLLCCIRLCYHRLCGGCLCCGFLCYGHHIKYGYHCCGCLCPGCLFCGSLFVCQS